MPINVQAALRDARLLHIHLVMPGENMQTAYMERRNDLSTPQAIYEWGANPEHNCDIGLHLPLLRELAHGDIVEIGVRGGSSTSAFVLGLRERCECGHSSELHKGHSQGFGNCNMYNVGCECQSFRLAKGHLHSIDTNPLCGTEVFEPMSEWTFICGHSTLDFDRIRSRIPDQIDILFLDSEHNYEQVRDELELYAPLVKRDGLILFHDIELTDEEARKAGLRYQPGVMKAAREFIAGNFDHSRLEVRHGSYGLGIIWLA